MSQQLKLQTVKTSEVGVYRPKGTSLICLMQLMDGAGGKRLVAHLIGNKASHRPLGFTTARLFARIRKTIRKL